MQGLQAVGRTLAPHSLALLLCVCKAWLSVDSSGLGGAAETQGHGSHEHRVGSQECRESACFTSRFQPLSESLLLKTEAGH